MCSMGTAMVSIYYAWQKKNNHEGHKEAQRLNYFTLRPFVILCG